MGKVRAPIDPVADLRRRLARSGARALSHAAIRGCVTRWWSDHDLASHPASVGKRIANVLLEQRAIPPKLAGILVLELLGEQLRVADLPAFERLFTGGHLEVQDVVDRFATRVLAALLARESGQAEAARAIASWRSSENGWQRRAACIAFTGLAARGDATVPGLTSMILGVCATVVWSIEPCDQTAVGQLLRELARSEPDRVEAFFVRHARFMSRACARTAVATFSPEARRALLAQHTQATTLRRR